MPHPPRQPRIAWPVALLAVAAIAGGIAALIAELRGGDEPAELSRVNSERSSSGATFAFADPAETYQVTYRIEDSAGDVLTEVVAVRRPFDSRTETYRGEGTDGTLVDVEETEMGIVVTQREGTPDVGLAPAPGVPDARFAEVADDAVRLGLLERRELREVAGRTCQVFRTAPETGLGFQPSAQDDYLDLCVDRAGVLLEEWEISGGRPLRQRVAVAVRTGLDLDRDDLFRLPHMTSVDANKGGGSVRRVDPTSEPEGTFWVLDAPPAGFRFIGRFALVPPQAALANPEQRGEVIASTADVYVRGADLLVVDRGGRLDRAAAFAASDELPDVEIDGIGTADFLASKSGGELRLILEDDRFIRVYGTVPLDVLRETAESLRRTDGGTGLVYVD